MEGIKPLLRRAGILCSIYMAIAAAGWILMLLLTGCRTQERIVTVPEVHELWHHQSDTVIRTDSVVDRQTTIVKEVDSATMAEYGIQLEAMQRAWLVKNDRLLREMRQLRQTKADTVVERDTIPLPYPVYKTEYRDKPLRAWQKALMCAGTAATLLLCAWIIIRIRKWRQN